MGECAHKQVLTIVLIGAGRLAHNLGQALLCAGHDIVQVFSRTRESAAALAEKVGASSVTDVEAVISDADIYIICVSDSALRDVASRVCRGREHRLFVHTAGSMPVDVFKGLAERYGVLYPMQTFSKEKTADFSVIPFFIEASDEITAGEIAGLAGTVGGSVTKLSSASRRTLHLAAVFACNFVNHCYALSADILASEGIPFDVMLPLIDETARKVHGMSPASAQTGPAVRYDVNVIRRQSGMLSDRPLMKDIYELMSKSIHRKELDNDKL